MIILNRREVIKESGKGAFFCPGCEVERQYTRSAVYDALSLYGLVLKMGDARQEFIECQNCHSRYPEEMLQARTGVGYDALLPLYNDAIKSTANRWSARLNDREKIEAMLNHADRLTGEKALENEVVFETLTDEWTEKIKRLAGKLDTNGKAVLNGILKDMAVHGSHVPEVKDDLEFLSRTLTKAL